MQTVAESRVETRDVSAQRRGNGIWTRRNGTFARARPGPKDFASRGPGSAVRLIAMIVSLDFVPSPRGVVNHQCRPWRDLFKLRGGPSL
jgi:hypothetical protein